MKRSHLAATAVAIALAIAVTSIALTHDSRSMNACGTVPRAVIATTMIHQAATREDDTDGSTQDGRPARQPRPHQSGEDTPELRRDYGF